jgi:hypothetical protein
VSIPGEIAIQTEVHPSGRWITIPLIIGESHDISAVLDTGAPVSAISPRVEHRLLSSGLLGASALPRRYRLRNITADRQPLPDLDIAVIRRLDRLGVDGLLGLDFLTHFERVHFHTRSLLLVLEPG